MGSIASSRLDRVVALGQVFPTPMAGGTAGTQLTTLRARCARVTPCFEEAGVSASRIRFIFHARLCRSTTHPPHSSSLSSVGACLLQAGTQQVWRRPVFRPRVEIDPVQSLRPRAIVMLFNSA